MKRGGLTAALVALEALGLGCRPSETPSETPRAPTSVPAQQRRSRYPIGGDYFWNGGETLHAPGLVIHLRDQELEVFDDRQLVARSSVCTGRRSHPTPTGSFKVMEKIPEHVSNRYGDYVDESGNVLQVNIDNLDVPPPPGATFRGTKMPFFLRIVGGVGLHAGPLPGHPDSHGCVRLPPFIAQRLFQTVELGTPVTVED